MVSEKEEEFLGFAAVVSVEAVVPPPLVAVPSSFNEDGSETGFTVIDWSIKAFQTLWIDMQETSKYAFSILNPIELDFELQLLEAFQAGNCGS